LSDEFILEQFQQHSERIRRLEAFCNLTDDLSSREFRQKEDSKNLLADQHQKILILGGTNENSTLAEILTLKNQSEIINSCLISLRSSYSTGAYIDAPVICGGYPETTHCNIVKGQAKKFLAELSQERTYAASGVMNDGALWITGGYPGPTDTSELVKIGKNTSSIGPALPMSLYGHCLQKLNRSHFVLIGGHDGKKLNPKSFFFDGSQWIEGPHLRISRKYHSCALLHFSTSILVVVAGGEARSGITAEVEFLNLEVPELGDLRTRQMHWIKGPSLPRPLYATSLVPTLPALNHDRKSLIVVGGHDGGNCRTEMYQLSCSTPTNCSSSWRKLERELEVPRCHFVTMKVPSSLDICPN